MKTKATIQLILFLTLCLPPITASGQTYDYSIANGGAIANYNWTPGGGTINLYNGDVMTLLSDISPAMPVTISISAGANVTVNGNVNGTMISNLSITETAGETALHTVSINNLKFAAAAGQVAYQQYKGVLILSGINEMDAGSGKTAINSSALTIGGDGAYLTVKGNGDDAIQAATSISIQGTANVIATGGTAAGNRAITVNRSIDIAAGASLSVNGTNSYGIYFSGTYPSITNNGTLDVVGGAGTEAINAVNITMSAGAVTTLTNYSTAVEQHNFSMSAAGSQWWLAGGAKSGSSATFSPATITIDAGSTGTIRLGAPDYSINRSGTITDYIWASSGGTINLADGDVMTILPGATQPTDATTIAIAADANVTINGNGTMINNLNIEESMADANTHNVNINELQITALTKRYAYFHSKGIISLAGYNRFVGNNVGSNALDTRLGYASIVTSSSGGYLRLECNGLEAVFGDLDVRGTAAVEVYSGTAAGMSSENISIAAGASLTVSGAAAGYAIANSGNITVKNYGKFTISGGTNKVFFSSGGTVNVQMDAGAVTNLTNSSTTAETYNFTMLPILSSGRYRWSINNATTAGKLADAAIPVTVEPSHSSVIKLFNQLITIAQGDAVALIENKINDTAMLSLPGDTVIVDGRKTGANATMFLDIPADITVVWGATYAADPAFAGDLISLNGAGNFVVDWRSFHLTGNAEISAAGGYAVNSGGQAVSIGFGRLFGYGASTANVINVTPTITEPGAVIAWNKAAGNTTYTAGTNTDISIYPASYRTEWTEGGYIGYISENYSSNYEVPGVTVTLQPAPNAGIDYATESLTNLEPGEFYDISSGISSTSTMATANGTCAIPDYAFGKTISVSKRAFENQAIAISAEQTLAIPARPAAPTTVGSTDETVIGANDGSITGVNANMEYLLQGVEMPWTDCTNTGVVTGLAPGTYEVRWKANVTAFASESATVVVAASTTAAVCEITTGGVTKLYATLDEALADISTGTPATIRLLDNISVNNGISLGFRTVTFDLNGKNLDISNASGNGLSLYDCNIDYTGAGSFTVSSAGGGFALSISGGGSCMLTGAKANPGGGNAIYAGSGAVVTVNGDVASSGSDNTNAISANDSGTKITVTGNVTITGAGCIAINVSGGAVVAVAGSITASGTGSYGASLNGAGSMLTVDGAVTARTFLQLNGADYDAAKGVADATKSGYLKYSDGVSTAWVKGIITGSDNPQATGLQAWIKDGTLYVSGLTVGKTWSVYNVAGELLYQGIAAANDVETLHATSLPNGIYIVQSENRSVKATAH